MDDNAMTGAQWIVERLIAQGVRHVFGVGGANIEDVFAAVQRRRPVIRAVLCKHEHGAGSAADGYARIGGGLGVALATSGGGALNLVHAMAEAKASRVPVLAIIGDPPSALHGRGAFQDTSGRGSVDALAVHRAASVWCRRAAKAEEIPTLVAEAIASALGERGPAVLFIAKDHQTAPIGARPQIDGALAATAIDTAGIARAVNVLGDGRVVVIAGDEIARSGAGASLARVVERLDAQVAVAPDARDAFDNGSPRFLGVAGAMGHDAVRRALAEAGVVLIAGTRMPLLARAGLEPQLARVPLVSFGSGVPWVVGKDGVHIEGPLRVSLDRLGDALTPRRLASMPTVADAGPLLSPGPLTLATTLATVATVATLAARDRHEQLGVILVDAGNTGAAAIHHLRCPADGRWLVAMGMGGMGWTYGAAIGAACASGRRVLAVTGDGAFFMHGFEIHTAVEHRLPITWVVLNNRAHGMCLVRERVLLGEHAGYNAFATSHLGAGLATMFPGLAAFDCASQETLALALEQAAAQNGPAVIVAELAEVEIPPFGAFERARKDGLTAVPR